MLKTMDSDGQSCTLGRSAAVDGVNRRRSGTRPYRLLAVASHVIQYQGPLFRALAAHPDIDLTVLFCSDWGLRSYRNKDFGHDIKWDIPLLEGYRTEFLPNWSPTEGPNGFWSLNNPSLIRRIKKGQFDAVWVHGWAHFSNLLAIWKAGNVNIPVLLRGETNLLPKLPHWKQVLKRALLSRLFDRISGFLAIGRYNAEFYSAYGVPNEKIHHVPYAVNNEFFLSCVPECRLRRLEIRHGLGIDDDVPLILFSGKLIPAKAPMDLLQSFEEVSKRHRAALLFVGDGTLCRDLKAYTEEKRLPNVHFAGFHNQTALPRFFCAADIFVLPSVVEPWGLVVNEAMCFGLPVIVSDQVGAGGDLVRDGENGFIYPAGQKLVLADKIESLLSNGTRRLRMGEMSRKMILTWSYQEDIDGIIRCLKNVALETEYQTRAAEHENKQKQEAAHSDLAT
jgi:glycosyltransferase involved in cell wall biosynthesis